MMVVFYLGRNDNNVTLICFECINIVKFLTYNNNLPFITIML